MAITVPTDGYITIENFLASYFFSFSAVANRTITNDGIERIITAKFHEVNGLLRQRGVTVPTSGSDARIPLLSHMNGVGAAVFIGATMKGLVQEEGTIPFFNSLKEEWKTIREDLKAGNYDDLFGSSPVVTTQEDFNGEEGNLEDKDWSL